MVDDTLPGGGALAPVCPWCSTPLIGAPENCPTCGATVDAGDAADPALPGLTAIDAAAIVRAKQAPPRSRNRLLSWISGDYPETSGKPGDSTALAPPDLEVRREILRLELEAEVAALHAEAGAIRAEAAVEGTAPGASPAAAAAAAAVTADLDAIEAELERVDEALETDPLLVAAPSAEPVEAAGATETEAEPGPVDAAAEAEPEPVAEAGDPATDAASPAPAADVDEDQPPA
jgi:hypothetical protein